MKIVHGERDETRFLFSLKRVSLRISILLYLKTHRIIKRDE